MKTKVKNNKKVKTGNHVSKELIYILIYALLQTNFTIESSTYISIDNYGGQITQHKVYLSGHFSTPYIPKSVTMHLWKRIISENKRMFTPCNVYVANVIGNTFRFEIDSINSINYFSISWQPDDKSDEREFLPIYLIEPNDSIELNISKGIISHSNTEIPETYKLKELNTFHFDFAGRGSPKYQCRSLMDEKNNQLQTEWENLHNNDIIDSKFDLVADLRRNQEAFTYFLNGKMEVFSKFSSLLSKESRQILETDIQSETLNNLYGFLCNNLSVIPGLSQKQKEQLKKIVEISDTIHKSVPNYVLAKSAKYSTYLLKKLIFNNALFFKKNIYSTIKTDYKSPLKDKLIVNYLLDEDWHWTTNEQRKIEADALQQIHIKLYHDVLKRYSLDHSKGAEIKFSLPDTSDHVVKIGDFKGKVIFVDFWFVGCGGCSSYYKNIVSKVEEKYRANHEVIFVTISIDVDKNKWINGIKSGNYTSSNVINLHTYPLGINDPIIRQLKVYSYPHPLLISRSGKIFSDSAKELRSNGVIGLSAMIEKALKII